MHRLSQRLDSAYAITASVLALFVAAGVAARAASAPVWVIVALAGVGLAGAAAHLLLSILLERRRRRAQLHAPLARRPQRLSELDIDSFYVLGVDAEAHEALSTIGVSAAHAPYSERDIDRDLRSALREGLAEDTVTLIAITGHSKAGKSRTALEAAREAASDAWLVVPNLARPATLGELTEGGFPVDGPVVLWLDDLESWARPDGLSQASLEQLERTGQPVVILATAFGRGLDLAGDRGIQFKSMLDDLLTRSKCFALPSRPASEPEREGIRRTFGDAAVERLQADGVGEFLVAAPRLIHRFEHGDSSTGQAIVQCAIDCRRAGSVEPIPLEWLKELFATYLPAPSGADDFSDGLKWATARIYANTALLMRSARTDEEAYEPYDFIVAHTRDVPMSEATWDYVIEHCTPECLGIVGAVACRAGDADRGERAFARGDATGDPLNSYNLGIVRMFRGKGDLAEAAYRRSAERGHMLAATNLGVLLLHRGEAEEAEIFLRQGDEAGLGIASSNLGVLLRQLGDLQGAEAAFRRGDERGNAIASCNYAEMLWSRGEMDEAEAALRRADALGDGSATRNLGVFHLLREERDEAEAEFRRADERGNALGALNHGDMLRERGKLNDAEAAFARAWERGLNLAAARIGEIRLRVGRREEAIGLYRQGDEAGDGAASANLGVILLADSDCDREEVVEIFRRGDDHGDGAASANLGVLLYAAGDTEAAEEAFGRAARRGESAGPHNLGKLLANRGDHAGARRAREEAGRCETDGRMHVAIEMGTAAQPLGMLLTLTRLKEVPTGNPPDEERTSNAGGG